MSVDGCNNMWEEWDGGRGDPRNNGNTLLLAILKSGQGRASSILTLIEVVNVLLKICQKEDLWRKEQRIELASRNFPRILQSIEKLFIFADFSWSYFPSGPYFHITTCDAAWSGKSIVILLTTQMCQHQVITSTTFPHTMFYLRVFVWNDICAETGEYPSSLVPTWFIITYNDKNEINVISAQKKMTILYGLS